MFALWATRARYRDFHLIGAFYEAASPADSQIAPDRVSLYRLLTYGPRLVNVNLCTYRAGAYGFLVTAARSRRFHEADL